MVMILEFSVYCCCWLTDQLLDRYRSSVLPSMAPSLLIAASQSMSTPTFHPSPSNKESQVSTTSTNFPVDTPSLSPSIFESRGPMSSGPSKQQLQTSEPANPTHNAIVDVSYSIVIDNGLVDDISFSLYQPDLIDAMNRVALDVAIDLHGGGHGEGDLRKLALQKMLALPTWIEHRTIAGFTNDPKLINGVFVSGPCPTHLGDASLDRCEEITASVGLLSATTEDKNNDSPQQFQANLEQALLDGRLVEVMQEFYDGSAATVLSGLRSKVAPPPPIDDKERLTAGLAVGVVIWGLVVVGALALMVTVLKRREFSAATSSNETPKPDEHNLEFQPEAVSRKDVKTGNSVGTKSLFTSSLIAQTPAVPTGPKVMREENSSSQGERNNTDDYSQDVLSSSFTTPTNDDDEDGEEGQEVILTQASDHGMVVSLLPYIITREAGDSKKFDRVGRASFSRRMKQH